MICRRMLLIAIPLLLSSAMIGCASKIRVTLRDSVTREPIVGALVEAGHLVKLSFSFSSHTSDRGTTNTEGIVILYIDEEEYVDISISPYYSSDTKKFYSGWYTSWSMSIKHPARYGNTDWVPLYPIQEYADKITDPEIEIKLEEYIEDDDKGRSKDNK